MNVMSSDTFSVNMDESHVMTMDVQTMAKSVYDEFERLIQSYDENVVKDLMPLIISILESLDRTVIDKQKCDVEIELIRVDNEQLLTQYQREKQLRQNYEQKYLAYEDAAEEEQKKLEGKIESLESIVRLFEIKMKNAQDQISRYEDREGEAKSEYAKLHERYTDLFKAHLDYRERVKFAGSDRVSVDTSQSRRITTSALLPSGPVAGYPSLANLDLFPPKIVVASQTTPRLRSCAQQSAAGELSFEQEVKNMETDEESKSRCRETKEVDMITDNIDVQERGTGTRLSEQMSTRSSAASEFAFESSNEPNITAIKTTPSEVIDRYRITAASGDFLSLQTSEGDEIEEYMLQSSNKNKMSVFDELYKEDIEALGQIDNGAEITGDASLATPTISVYNETEQDDDHDSTAMSREVENLIQENNELLATKNALNVVKDDLIARVDQLTSENEIFREEVHSLQVVKEKLKTRIEELEDEMKRMREDLEKEKCKASVPNEEEDDVPMAQRKRFTRVEMARVLLERNQYKERLMELQEAVRWTEMIRASNRHADLTNKKKSSLWNFFSNLFGPSKPSKKPIPLATVHYNSPNTSLKPIVEPSQNSTRSDKQGPKAKAFDFLQDDFVSAHEQSTFYVPVTNTRSVVVTDKSRQAREQERREQYKQTCAVVKRDDGRLQAYGWSLPAKFSAQVITEAAAMKSPQLTIPIPIYCRPVMEDDATTKLWCAAAVNLMGGKTRDGGSIVGASVFYSSAPDESVGQKTTKNEVEKLNQEIQEHEKDAKSTETDQTSSLVWICTSNKSGSEVAIIDANSPGDILENFPVSSSNLICITSIPGAMEDDYEADADIIQCERSSSETIHKTGEQQPSSPSPTNVGLITFVNCSTGRNSIRSKDDRQDGARVDDDVTSAPVTTAAHLEKEMVFTDSASDHGVSGGRSRRFVREPDSELVKDGIGKTVRGNKLVSSEMEKSSSILPTMWIGAQSGSIFVHSAVSQWKRCLHTVRLNDSVLSISHVKGRVFVALADGTVAVFRRDSLGQWNLSDYHLITLGEPQHSVRCVCVIANNHVWCGYRNTIHILNPKTLQIEKSFDAHPRKESQVRQMAWVGEGVWLSIRLDSTLRLYHAYTHEHLQDVDIEPYVSKLLGSGKLGFSFVRISCLMTSCNRLWIGTGNGVIVSVPLSETNDPGILTSMSACNSNKQALTSSGVGRPGGVIRVYSDNKTDSIFPGSFIPYCSIAQAQLSFHGHKDAVKFFVTVPGLPTKGISGMGASATTSGGAKEKDPGDGRLSDVSNLSKNLLVISGGEGYVDFRLGEVEDESLVGDEEQKEAALSKGECSHLIVWKVSMPTRHRPSFLHETLPSISCEIKHSEGPTVVSASDSLLLRKNVLR